MDVIQIRKGNHSDGKAGGLRPWLRNLLVAVGVVIVIAGVSITLGAEAIWGVGRGNPDPGGRRLEALSSVSIALPENAHVHLRTVAEPHWDSCDGRKGTFGWSDVSVYYEFTTNEGESQLAETAASILTSHGWRVTQQTNAGGPYLIGRKFLDKTIPLKVTLSANYQVVGGPISYWDLSAFAPPSGQRVSGC